MFSDVDIAKLVEIAKTVKKAREEAIEECARVAAHLSGWGNKVTQQSGLAEHIAKCIRALKDKP